MLAKHLNNNASITKKYAALVAFKKLILTAYHHYYILSSVKMLSWVSSIAQFEPRKNEHERARLYVKQLALKGNGD